MERLSRIPLPERPDRDVDIAEDAWQTYRLLTGTDDFDKFTNAYVGNWSNLDAFGSHLIETIYGGGQQLERLPTWLRGYVRLDSGQAARDFGRAGHYAYIERPRFGLHVFDGGRVPIAGEDLRATHGFVDILSTTRPQPSPICEPQGAM